MYGVKLHVWGDYACFTRPETKVERVSYDAMTPSAARGILEAIHWKPAVRWEIDRIHVLKPIRFENFRRNELGGKLSASNVQKAMKRGSTEDLHTVIETDRQQRATTLLRDVGYVIEAHFSMTEAAGPRDSEAGHAAMFSRRAAQGQCFHRPYLGTRECVAYFDPVVDRWPASTLPDEQRNRDLGLMLFDIEHGDDGAQACYFRAQIKEGVIDVPAIDSAEVLR